MDKVGILIVDDEKPNLASMHRFLKKFPLRIYKAEDGQKALEVFKLHKPKIVLTDVRIPKKMGWN